MVSSEDDLMKRFEELGIETSTVRHEAVFTVEQAQALRGELPGWHSKNLFLKDKKGALWLVVCEEDRPVNLKAFRGKIGAASLSFAKPELLREVLGVEPGSVTPFSVINDHEVRVKVVLDATMLKADTLNFHPLVNTATTAIAPQDLLVFLRACGHEPEIADFDEGMD
jgi:Ala-tRNA(Pro) deacylase